MKPHIPVTLIAVDTGPRVDLTAKAIQHCLNQANFDDVKLLTHETHREHAIEIPRFEGVKGYSDFVVRQLHKHIRTSHCLLIQWDGYILNGLNWQDRFLSFDYIGAAYGNWVGLGGFSLRSKRLLEVASRHRTNESAHPEDNFLSLKYRSEFEKGYGMRYGTHEVARGFVCEGRRYNSRTDTWSGTGEGWSGEFGFHSYLTKLNGIDNRPKIFHHSGDLGDIIYALPTIKALGGGVLYISPQVTPLRVRETPSKRRADSVESLLRHQPYIWAVVYTETRPASTDYDLNQFRRAYTEHRVVKGRSIVEMIGRQFGTNVTGKEPWLTLPGETIIPNKDIVVARSERYLNPNFPWRELVEKHSSRMMFVGTQKEHEIFCKQWGSIHYQPTKDLEELARTIQGAKLFIGNQSAPLAIALALGKNTITEAWAQDPNCNMWRENQVHYLSGKLEFPEEWLNECHNKAAAAEYGS